MENLYILIFPVSPLKISSLFATVLIHDPHNPPFNRHRYVDENRLYMSIPFSDVHALNHGHETDQ